MRSLTVYRPAAGFGTSPQHQPHGSSRHQKCQQGVMSMFVLYKIQPKQQKASATRRQSRAHYNRLSGDCKSFATAWAMVNLRK